MTNVKSGNIPTTLDALRVWVENWFDLMGALAVNAPNFGIPAAIAPSGFDALRTTFLAALAANGPGERTAAGTDALFVAKTNLLNYVRPYAQMVSNFPEPVPPAGVSPGFCTRSQKAKLRVGTHATSRAIAGTNALPRTRIDEPTTAPAIDVQPSGNLQVKVRYHFDGAPLRGNSGHISSSAKPKFAASVQFYYKLLAPVPGRNFYEGMVPMKTATRSPFLMDFDPQIGGRQVYVAARYVNPRGMVGPWSAMTTCTVPIEGVSISNVPA